MSNEPDKAEFDEDAVLEELERLRGAIRLARSKREEKVAEFETFMRDARMAARREALRAAGVEPDDDELRTEPAHPIQTAEGPEFALPTVPAWSPPPSLQFEPPAPDPVSRLDDMSEATAAFPDSGSSHWTRDRFIIAGAALVLILVLILVSWIGGDSASLGTPRQATPSGSQPGAPAGSPARTGPPSQAGEVARAPTAPLPLQVELVAVQKVWLRVTVDGDKAIEQEVEEGQHLRFGANKAIVVRAGDAGAVTISVDGQAAAPLGRAGQPATRTIVPRQK